jgi:hypothetical protein
MNSRLWNPASGVALAAALVLGALPLGVAQAMDLGNELAKRHAREVQQRTLEMRRNGPWAKPVLLYVASAEQWNEAMQKLAAEGALMVLPAPQAPEGVAWEREAVLLVALGPQMQLGVSLAVQQVKSWQRRLLLDVDVNTGSSSMTRSVYSPYHLVCVAQRPWTRGNGRLGPNAPEVEASYHYYCDEDGAAAVGSTTAPQQTDGPAERAVSWGGVKDLYR